MSAIFFLKVLVRVECVAYFTSFRWSVKRYIKGVGEGGGEADGSRPFVLIPIALDAASGVRCIKVEFARKCIDHRVFFSVFFPWLCCNKSHDRSRVKFCPPYDSYSTSVSVAARVLLFDICLYPIYWCQFAREFIYFSLVLFSGFNGLWGWIFCNRKNKTFSRATVLKIMYREDASLYYISLDLLRSRLRGNLCPPYLKFVRE